MESPVLKHDVATLYSVSFSKSVNIFILDWFQHWNKATFYWCSKVIVIQGYWIVWIDNLGLRLVRPSCWPSYDVLTRNTLLQGSIRIKQITQSLNFHFYHPPTKLREGNVFKPVCHSVHEGGIWYHFLSGCLVPCSFQRDMMSLPVWLPGPMFLLSGLHPGGSPSGEFPSRGRSPSREVSIQSEVSSRGYGTTPHPCY